MKKGTENITKDTTEIQTSIPTTDIIDGDTIAIDTKQLKELSSNTTTEMLENPSEAIDIIEYGSSQDNNEAIEDVVSENSNDDSVLSNNNTIEDDFDEGVEGQIDLFDEDDFSSPDDKIVNAEPIEKPLQETETDAYKPEFNFTISAKMKKWLIGIVIVIIVFFALAYILGITTLPIDTTYKNIYVEDIDVGGLTYDEVLKKLSSDSLFENQNINIAYQNQNYTIDGKDISLEASVEATAKKAYDYGKTGNRYIDGLYNMLCLFTRHTIMPVASVDNAKLDEYIIKFANQCLGELKQHNIVVQADGLVYIGAGETGFDMNVEPARKRILNSLANDQFSDIKIPISPTSPKNLTLEAFDAAVYCDPIDAHFAYDADEVTIVPEQIGRYINKEEAAPLLKNVREGASPVYIPWYKSDAQITAPMLEEKLFTSVIGSFSTYYGGTYNRNKNVERAAGLMNNAVIPPGEVFSFNDRVGPRTVANGFFTAPEYANGETVMGIGGGTCQVSTTLYGAILYADMDIVDRTEHMFPVSYAPLGQDATVYYGSLDFKFKNSSEYPIRIITKTGSGKLTV